MPAHFGEELRRFLSSNGDIPTRAGNMNENGPTSRTQQVQNHVDPAVIRNGCIGLDIVTALHEMR